MCLKSNCLPNLQPKQQRHKKFHISGPRTQKNLKVLNISGISNVMDHSTLNWISRLCPNLEELVLDNGLIKRKAAKQFARNVKGEKVRLEPTTVQKQVQPDEQDMSSPDCSLIHPRLLGQSRLKPCLGPGYFLLKVSDCMLETCMLLSGVRVHEHRWEWVFIICIICCVNLFISNSLHFTHAKFNATFQCALRSLSKQT